MVGWAGVIGGVAAGGPGDASFRSSASSTSRLAAAAGGVEVAGAGPAGGVVAGVVLADPAAADSAMAMLVATAAGLTACWRASARAWRALRVPMPEGNLASLFRARASLM